MELITIIILILFGLLFLVELQNVKKDKEKLK